MLRQSERLLAAQYGADGPPKLIDSEDLECEDPADVEHWVAVYTELVDFTRSLLETAPSPAESVGGPSTPEHASCDLRALMLLARVQELHLTYWTERRDRLRSESGFS